MNDWEVEMLEPHNRSLKKLEKKSSLEFSSLLS
jgi:hypothetical protein